MSISSLKAMLLSAALLGCASSSAQAKNDDVSVFYFSLNDNFISQLSIDLQNNAIDKRIKLRQYDANSDGKLQNEQIKNVLAKAKSQNPIMVNPVNDENGYEILELAKKYDTPVIFFNRKPNLENFDTYDKAWYVGSDPKCAGEIQARIVTDYLRNHPEADKNKDGKINYVIFQGEPSHNDTSLRTTSFIEAMKKTEFKLKAIESVYADWNASIAENHMISIVRNARPENIELVVSNNDAMALGAITALQKAGYNLPHVLHTNQKETPNPKSIDLGHAAADIPFIPVVGIDAIPAAIDAVERGTMLGTVYNDSNTTSDVVIRLAYAYIHGIEITDEFLGYPVASRMVDIQYRRVSNGHQKKAHSNSVNH